MKVSFFYIFGFFDCFFLSAFYFHMGDIRVASLNVNGARDCVKRSAIYEMMGQKRIDILFLQETHNYVTNANEWTREFKSQDLT